MPQSQWHGMGLVQEEIHDQSNLLFVTAKEAKAAAEAMVKEDNPERIPNTTDK